MIRKLAFSAAAVLAALITTPTLANVTLHLSPEGSTIAGVGSTTAVDIRADFTQSIIGWGLDVQLGQPGIAELVGISFGSFWDGGVSIDGDGLSAISDPMQYPLGIGPGSDILLATLTFEGLAVGVTPVTLSISGEEDEGFLLGDLSGYDTVTFAAGTITVPEPAGVALALLGGLALLRRR
jgi:hypothetical protein